jgi:radical SAM superfamily enzyme YgiQ (UPF0313 family)
MPSTRPVALLVQLPVPPPGPLPVVGNVPLAAGYLKSFADARGLNEHFDIQILDPDLANALCDRGLVDEILGRDPVVVGFTCYLWNVERSLWIADNLKQRRPEMTIVLGGPEITEDNAWVFAAAPIDWAIIGEGEAAYAELLEKTRTNSFARSHSSLGPEMITSHPLPDLNDIPSPYLSGLIATADRRMMVLESVRGCPHRCKFCYYPKGNKSRRFFSLERLAAELEYAVGRGVEEVVFLDPSLNGRRDFERFLELLCKFNEHKRLRFSGELRAETLNTKQVDLLAKAGFFEVEIGLQSVDTQTQRLMGRITDTAAFARGAKALMAAGVTARVDLIVGLPGDTIDSVRRSIDFLADTRAYSEAQIFNLSILPGTAFRKQAGRLGLSFQDRPPYYVLQTPTLNLDQMTMLTEEAQDVLGTEMEPLPEPVLEFEERPHGPVQIARVNLDRENEARGPIDLADSLPPSGRRAQAFTLWLASADFHATHRTASKLVRQVLDDSPHTTLQVVLDPAGKPQNLSADVLAHLLETCYRTVSYLDRHGSVQPGRFKGAKRLIVVASQEKICQMDSRRREEIEEYATLAQQD